MWPEDGEGAALPAGLGCTRDLSCAKVLVLQEAVLPKRSQGSSRPSLSPTDVFIHRCRLALPPSLGSMFHRRRTAECVRRGVTVEVSMRKKANVPPV